MMMRYLYLLLTFFILNCSNSIEENKSIESSSDLPTELRQDTINFFCRIHGVNTNENDIYKIKLDTFNKIFSNLDLNCYDLSKSVFWDSMMNNELKYYDELAYIIFEDGSTKEFYLKGYLIDFTIYTDSIYQIISIREGEAGQSVALTMINSEFKIIDSQRLSISGGDEEDVIIQKGCFRNKNEYFSENTFYSPLIIDSVYTETFFELKLTIQSNGEILEEEQGRITDTIIAKITPGDYRNFEKNKIIRILEQNKVQILSYDEKGVMIDSIFGNYHYNSRERDVNLYLFMPYKDEFEIDTYKYLNDTARVSMNQNCILYKKENYCIN